MERDHRHVEVTFTTVDQVLLKLRGIDGLINVNISISGMGGLGKILSSTVPLIFLPAKKDYNPDTNEHFQNAMALVKHVLVYPQFIYDLVAYPWSQNMEEEREYYMEKDNQDIKDGFVQMTDEEKETRKWMPEHYDFKKHYKLLENFTCPRQRKTSSDCGAYMLYVIESLCCGKKTNKSWCREDETEDAV